MGTPQRDGTEIAVISHENVSKPSKHHLSSQETLLTSRSNSENTEIRFSQIDSILIAFCEGSLCKSDHPGRRT